MLLEQSFGHFSRLPWWRSIAKFSILPMFGISPKLKISQRVTPKLQTSLFSLNFLCVRDSGAHLKKPTGNYRFIIDVVSHAFIGWIILKDSLNACRPLSTENSTIKANIYMYTFVSYTCSRTLKVRLQLHSTIFVNSSRIFNEFKRDHHL